MTKQQLPNVTLLMIESNVGHHQLAKLAVEDCLAVADFGDILIMADQFNELRFPGARYISINGGDKIDGYCRPLWYFAPQLVKTKQVLIIQYDSWICHADLWQDKFLDYDYIGAPWLMDDKHNMIAYGGPILEGTNFVVGNSGFSFRSKKLIDYIAANKETMPLIDSCEDFLLSITYNKQLREAGFKWADGETALQFSAETVRTYRSDDKYPGGYMSWGFHGVSAWPYVLEKDRLIERAKLFAKNDYVRRVKYMSGKTMLESLVAEAPYLHYFVN